jgi:hypothetical protein
MREKGEAMSKDNTEVANTQVLTPQELTQVVRDLATRAPVVAPVTVTSDQQRRRLTTLDPRFVEASVSAVASTAQVQAALGRTDDDVRTEDASAFEWATAIDAVGHLYRQLLDANGRRRQRIGLTALQTYQICTSLARDAVHALVLKPHVDAMRRLHARRRRQQPVPVPSPSPAPQQ